jgi:hypothetical protein
MVRLGSCLNRLFGIIDWASHYLRSVDTKCHALFRLCHHVDPHLVCVFMFNLYQSLFHLISNVEEPLLDMFGSLTTVKIVCFTSNPCARKKCTDHKIVGKASCTPTISVSVELLVFIFCFIHNVIAAPSPKVNPAPVCPRISRCTPCDASTNQVRNPGCQSSA